MAHLWVTDQSGRWAVLPLESDAFTLSSSPPKPVAPKPDARRALSDVLLIRAGSAQTASWVLMAGRPAGVTVNGMPLILGIRVVSDRDQIRLPEDREFYFSTESPARVERFPGSEQPLYCPRCKQEIEVGANAVKCPACGVWHHQADELSCWTYAEVCALCAQTTDMNAGFRWTPEEEG